jgi:hypothetical protein
LETSGYKKTADIARVVARMPPREALLRLCKAWLNDVVGWPEGRQVPCANALTDFVGETIAMHLVAIDEARRHPLVIADAVADRLDVCVAGLHERLDRIEACMVHGKPLQPAKKKARRSRK